MTPAQAWSAVAAALGAVILVGDALGALPSIEQFLPATRGYARDVIAQNQAAEVSQRRQIFDELRDTRGGILDLKIDGLEGRLEVATSQVAMVEARLALQPEDRLLSDLRKKLIADVATLKAQIARAWCQKAQLSRPDTIC